MPGNPAKFVAMVLISDKYIETGSSVFSPLKHSKMGDNVHFETQGMGLKHYFYRTDNILIWWQVEPDKAVVTNNDLLKYDFSILKDR